MWTVVGSHKKLSGPLGSYDSLSDPHLLHYFTHKPVQQKLLKSLAGSKDVDLNAISPENSTESKKSKMENLLPFSNLQKSLSQQSISKRTSRKMSRSNKVEPTSLHTGVFDRIDKIQEESRDGLKPLRSRLAQSFLQHAISPYLLPVIPNSSLLSSAFRTKRAGKKLHSSRRSQSAAARLEKDNVIVHDFTASNKVLGRESNNSLRSTRKNSIIDFHPNLRNNPSTLRTLCEITLLYHGNAGSHRTWFSSKIARKHDIHIWQQHCGGNPVTVYRNSLFCGDQLTFTSRRHVGYPFSITVFVNGMRDLMVSTCCEYRHPVGNRLGGKQGHFTLLHVAGGRPCYRCQVEKALGPLKASQHPPRTHLQTPKPIEKTVGLSKFNLKRLVPQRRKASQVRPVPKNEQTVEEPNVKLSDESNYFANKDQEQNSSTDEVISEEDKWSSSSEDSEGQDISEDLNDQNHAIEGLHSLQEVLDPRFENKTGPPVQESNRSTLSLEKHEDTDADTVSVEEKGNPTASSTTSGDETALHKHLTSEAESITSTDVEETLQESEIQMDSNQINQPNNSLAASDGNVTQQNNLNEHSQQPDNGNSMLDHQRNVKMQRTAHAYGGHSSSKTDWGDQKKMFKKEPSSSSDEDVQPGPRKQSMTVLVDVHANPSTSDLSNSKSGE